MKESDISLISGTQWATGLKSLGITTKDAMCELVDNSLDANAGTIHISVVESGKKKISLIVEDDGEGIPKEKIAEVLSFWRQNPKQRRQDPSGNLDGACLHQ